MIVLAFEKFVVRFNSTFIGQVTDSVQVNIFDGFEISLDWWGIDDFLSKADALFSFDFGATSSFGFVEGFRRGELKLEMMRRGFGLVALVMMGVARHLGMVSLALDGVDG